MSSLRRRPSRTRTHRGLLAALVALVALVVTLLVLQDDAAMTTTGVDAGTSALDTAPEHPGDPVLDHPRVIDIRKNGSLRLEDDRDYVLRLPCGAASLKAGLRVTGGRNVVLVGGEVHLPEPGRGLFLQDQTGTILVEGVRFTGDLTEGINLDQREGASVHFRNIKIDPIRGSIDANHADLIQSWAGPRELVVEGFEGTTAYQGLFLLPTQRFRGGTPERVSLDRVHLIMEKGSAYGLWRDDKQADWSPEVSHTYVDVQDTPAADPDDLYWPKPSTGDTSWAGATLGAPTEPVLTEEPGTGYTRRQGCRE